MNTWVTFLSVFRVSTILIKVLINELVYCITRNITTGYDRKRELQLIENVFGRWCPFSVFLTHVGIRQMPTWLPTWKAKSLYHVGTFLPKCFFLPFQKFKTINIKPEKNPYTQANTCLIQVSRNFKDIFKFLYILYSLFLVNCK